MTFDRDEKKMWTDEEIDQVLAEYDRNRVHNDLRRVLAHIQDIHREVVDILDRVER